MAYFFQQLINGVTLGSVYGLIAIGYTLVFGILGMINFAHGDIFMIGAFISLIAFALLGALGVAYMPLVLLVIMIVAVAVTAFYGWTMERVAYRPLRNSPRLAPLISAIGISIFLQNFVLLTQGARVKTMPPILNNAISVGGVSITPIQISIVAVTLVLMAGVTWFIKMTPLGRAQRAVAQDKIMAQLLGINVNRTISTTFIMAAMLAASAGLMVTFYYGVVDFFMGFSPGIKAFTAAVLGGIGSLPGAILGGLLIGLIESFWSAYFSIEYKDVATFIVLILVLMVRPGGLLGKADIEKI